MLTEFKNKIFVLALSQLRKQMKKTQKENKKRHRAQS